MSKKLKLSFGEIRMGFVLVQSPIKELRKWKYSVMLLLLYFLIHSDKIKRILLVLKDPQKRNMANFLYFIKTLFHIYIPEKFL